MAKKPSAKHQVYQWHNINLLRAGAAVLFLAAYIVAIIVVNKPAHGSTPTSASLRSYAVAKVWTVVSDNSQTDTWTEGRLIGTQQLQVQISGGALKGDILECTNYVTAYSGLWAKTGATVIVQLDKDEDGEPFVVSVYNFNRGPALLSLVLAFAALLVVIGGKKGLMALAGFAFTLTSLWFLLIPLMRKGLPPVPGAIAFAALVAAVSLYVLAGPARKTLCAILGCIGGVVAAGLCAMLIGIFTTINGFNTNEAEALVLLAKDDGLRISGLLAAGIMISSLGVVMNMSMTIASAGAGQITTDPKTDRRLLFRSCMGIGRETIGAMVSTLVLVLVGSSLNMLILLQVYQYPYINIFNSDLMMIEIMQGIAGTIGILLTVPLAAFISSRLLPKK